LQTYEAQKAALQQQLKRLEEAPARRRTNPIFSRLNNALYVNVSAQWERKGSARPKSVMRGLTNKMDMEIYALFINAISQFAHP